MTLEFKVAEGELAACTIMEQAAAIWKHYNFDVDKVEELIDYLKVAIDGEKIRAYNRESEAHPCTPFKRHYSSRNYFRGRPYHVDNVEE